MISTLRGFYALDNVSKDYYIFGAPQCVVPDAVSNLFDFSFFTPTRASSINGRNFEEDAKWCINERFRGKEKSKLDSLRG